MRSWPALEVRLHASSPEELPQLEERLAGVLDDLSPSAIQQLEGRWLVFFSSTGARDLAVAGLPQALPGECSVDAVDVADEDWAARSQQSLTAVEIGRVTIAPPWAVTDGMGAGRDAARLFIVIQPSMGFGTGHHATTRLCAALLQRLQLTNRTVLDVGTGSGVLALIAHALGAHSVIAVDNDPDAIESARENLSLNGVEDGVELRAGDFRNLQIDRADVVIANLTGSLLARSAEALASAVADDGTLVISGVTLEEEAAVLDSFALWMTLVERLTEDEWMAARLCPLKDRARRTAAP